MSKKVIHYLGGNIFAIRGRLCPKCITIEPRIYGYGAAVDASLLSILYPIHPECNDIRGMSYSERLDSLRLYSQNGFPEIVSEWVKLHWSSSLRMRITALKVPVSKLDPDKNNDVPSVGVAVDVLGNSPSHLRWSTGNSVKVVSRTFSNGENDKFLALDQKEIILYYVNSDFINLPKRIGSQSFPQAPNLDNLSGGGNADRRNIIEKAIESSDIIINTL